MKIWKSFSAEHSAKLRIVGTFKTTEDLEETRQIIEELTDEVMKQDVSTQLKAKYTDEIMNIIKNHNGYCHSLGEEDLMNFTHVHNISYNDRTIEINTDELDIQGLLKVILSNGAKIEIYSKHNYPNG